MYYRLAVTIAATLMAVSAVAKVPDVTGTVLDEKGDPMPFVNVVLLSLPDSSFVQGAMTDAQGHFQIKTINGGGLLKVSSVGYETQFLNPIDGLIVKMNEATMMLGEVVVKSQLPKTRVKGEALRTTVEGTILEKAGTVADALSRVPSLEAERDGAVKVLGRGEAEVYINGRKVQDMSELSRLRSDQIQHIDVIQNPGARYAASTKAVVRITLKKAQGDGFSFQDNVMALYQYGHTITNNVDLNYRTGGLDVTASFWSGRYGHVKMLQENNLFYFVGPDRVENHVTQEGKNIWKGLSPQLQVNYVVNENHSFGAFYKYDRHPSTDFHDQFFTDCYENGVFTEHSVSDIRQNDRFHKHIFNAYYNGKVGLLGLDLNVDGLFDNTETPGSTVEESSIEGDIINRSIESNTSSHNNFWASKLILSYPVWQGNLSVGGEYSHNHRTDAYSYSATASVPVKATDTKINESSTSAFVEYGRRFGMVFTQVGLRYEHLTNDYFNFGKREDEVCRDYGDWFPTAVISAPVGKVQLSLSYRRDIQRPNYSNLTSSTIYINRYTYQSGNPYLKPTYTHSLVFNAAYQWMNLTLNYARIKDSETMSTEPFPGSEDPLISLVRPINSAEDYNQLSIIPSLRPVIGCWHPTWSIFTVFQNYKAPRADGSVITLNHPLFQFSWDNDIELPNNWRLNVVVQCVAKGDYNNFRLSRGRFYSGMGVQRDIDLRHLGSLTIDLRCHDLFNTNKTEATIYGPRELTTANPARRTFALYLTWKFNSASSKYRGTGAGEKQKARM
ncbi:MAG: outer membrane beta-barrel family protein [Bacteroidales bacterium]|nr:outer membrane beta-barrel family protein [Bacteroidales bacterium]